MKKLIITFFAISLLWGCKKDDPNAIFQLQLAEDIAEIESFLADNNIDAIKDPTGVFYKIDEEGTGDHPTTNSFVSMAYEGRLMDGTVFDSANSANPLKEFLYRLISGWQVGVPKLKKGGSGTLYIPSGFGYGASGGGIIPGNAILIFDIELLNFN